MIRTQVYLPEDLYNEAKITAKLYGVKMSKLMRDGLRESIKKVTKVKAKKGTWENFIGACKTNFGKSGTDLINEYYEKDVV